MPKLSIIIPCYYNEQNIPVTSEALLENEKNFPEEVSFEYVMVDDGSKDNTYQALQTFHQQYPDKVKVVKLARNFGSFNAILAGLNHASGDCFVFLAADLQDPIDIIPKMYEYWKKGLKLVIANRSDRKEPFLKKMFANIYHTLLRKLAFGNIPTGGFDFIFFDKQLKQYILEIDEKNTNIFYLIAWLGFDFVSIPYVRQEREIGKSRWTFKKKLKLFIDSFVSFSYFPIRMISVTGLVMGAIAFLYGIFVIIAKIANMGMPDGWSSTMTVLLFVSAFQMIALGILGEYIWRILEESRKRPNFVVDKVIDTKTSEQQSPATSE